MKAAASGFPSDSDQSRCLPNSQVEAPGLEQPTEVAEKRGMRERRGTQSGTVGDDSVFAEAMAAVMRLPLSDAEKAEAVRRLLAAKARQ